MPGRLGLLPLAAPLFALLAARLGALLFPAEEASTAGARDRAVGGALAAVGLAILVTRSFGLLGWLAAGPLLAALIAATIASLAAPRLLACSRRFAFPWRALLSLDAMPLPSCAAIALALACAAAWLLPIWQPDALGYHLPYVELALQARATAGVPPGAPYIATYPHAIELFFLDLRALLPDERLADLGQLPFALLGALAVAGLARQKGAARGSALGAGAAWLCVPAVFLQIPTDYIDVGSASLLLCAAYFLLRPLEGGSIGAVAEDDGGALPSPSRRAQPPADARQPDPRGERRERSSLWLGVLATGLYAASKPNGPLGAAILSIAFLVKYWPTKHLRELILGLLLAAGFASESWLANWLRHGNPLWPARVQLGPLQLPGRNDLRELLESGARAPRLSGPLWARVSRSWTSLRAPPVCDMRYGGLGPLFLLALLSFPLRPERRGRALALTGLALLASIATPDPSVARYVLGLPGLLFALAAPRFDTLVDFFAVLHAMRLGARDEEYPRVRAPVAFVLSLPLALGAAWQLHYAAPGLTGEGPPLRAYLGMSEAERAVAVGAAGRPEALLAARARLGPGETFAIDSGFDQAALAFDGLHRVVWLDDPIACDPLDHPLAGRAIGGLCNPEVAYRSGYVVKLDAAMLAEVGARLARENVRVMAVHDLGAAARFAELHPEQWQRVERSKSAPWSLWARR